MLTSRYSSSISNSSGSNSSSIESNNSSSGNKYLTKTAKMYQYGYTKEQAKFSGGDAEEFQSLDDEFNGGSIPLHLLLGVEHKAPYSCEYHSSSELGKLLRAEVDKQRLEKVLFCNLS